MKYTYLSQDFFIKNRKKFCNHLDLNSLAIFNSNDTYPISSDNNFPFTQHRDIFYLSGIDQKESILLLFPQALEQINREILFLKETNDHIRIWEGPNLTKKQAQKISGIKNIYWISQFDSIFYILMSQAKNIYLNLNENYRYFRKIKTCEERFIKKIKKHYPLHVYKRSNPILQSLRSIKEPEEIEQLQIACNITEKGFRRVLEFVKPGVWEYEIEAEWIHEFLRHRAKGFAYAPIISSGTNSCILHYIKNNRQCRKGELLLMDVGACYANYNADLTRTLPVSGYYSKYQRKIYKAVLNVKDKASEMLITGNNWHDYYKEVGRIMTSELLDLGLLDRADLKNQNPKYPAYKKYFMHSVSHHIGLDIHDYGILSQVFQAGMVFTVEPGIYIPGESLGIRIEDNYVIQEIGPAKNLMKNTPVQIDEIENLMNKI